MLDINIALIVFAAYVLGTLTGLYYGKKIWKKTRSAFPNMAVKRRR